MIPSDLAEIFGVLFVGILAVFAVSTLIWIVHRTPVGLLTWLGSTSLWPTTNTGALLFILPTFGIGLIVQDITDHLTDVDTDYEKSAWYCFCQKSQQAILGKESDHRLSSLIQLKESGHELRGLGKEVFARHNRKLFEEAILVIKPREQKFIDNPEAFLDRVGTSANADVNRERKKDRHKCAKSVVNRLYYASKNWCYLQPTYFVELESVQRRIDFSRSCFLVSSWAFLFTLVAGAVSSWPFWPVPQLQIFLIRRWQRFLNKRSFYPSLQEPDVERAGLKNHITRIVVVLLLLTVACIITATGYKHAEEVFNERVFGYRLSHVISQVASSSPEELDSEPDNALMWAYTSAEYSAICLSQYDNAFKAVAEKVTLTEGTEGAKPPAVVLDLDETVFLNWKYNLFLEGRKSEFSDLTWNIWVEHWGDSVDMVPGFAEFHKRVRELDANIELVFISNRPEELGEHTFKVLQKLGVFPEMKYEDVNGTRLFLKEDNTEGKPDTGGKEIRRKKVTAKWNVLAWLGDNLADFSSDFEKPSSSDRQNGWWNNRRKLVTDPRFREKWGEEYFVFPNPVYGDWKMSSDESRRIVENDMPDLFPVPPPVIPRSAREPATK